MVYLDTAHEIYSTSFIKFHASDAVLNKKQALFSTVFHHGLTQTQRMHTIGHKDKHATIHKNMQRTSYRS